MKGITSLTELVEQMSSNIPIAKEHGFDGISLELPIEVAEQLLAIIRSQVKNKGL